MVVAKTPWPRRPAEIRQVGEAIAMPVPACTRPFGKRREVVSMIRVARKGAVAAVPLAVCLAAAACSSSSSPTAASTASSGTSAAVPSISVTDLNRTFSAMTALKPLAAEGKGNVAVILPDTVTSARYTEFDAPGLSPSQYSVVNAQGSDATELADAQEAITKGASVLIMDPLDSGVGAQIES